MIDIRDLRTVVEIADAGSLRRSAATLGLDVSTISRRLQRVEDALGANIFERARGGLTLTSGGQEILRFARRVVDDVDALQSAGLNAGLAKVGKLRLATQLSVLNKRLRSALRDFRASRPQIEFEITEASDRAIIGGLHDRRFEAAILFAPTITDDMASAPLWSEKLVVAVCKNGRLASRERVGWNEIKGEPVLVQGWTESEVYKRLEVGLLGPSANFRTHRAGCAELMGLVAINEGVMLALASHREFGVPDVILVDIDEPDAFIGVSLAWSPSLEDPLAGSFTSFMRNYPFAEI